MRRQLRYGMTLVELLVVITIIGVLGGIIALAAPRFRESTRVGQGTSEFKNWLENARLRAQRDRAPRGIRLLETLPSSINTTNQRADHYYKFVYLEQPDDITGVVGMVPLTPNVPRPDLDIQPNLNMNTAAPSAYAAALLNQRRLYQQAAMTALNLAAMAPGVPTALAQKYAGYANAINPANVNAWRYLLPVSGRILSGIVNDGDVVEFGGARYTLVFGPVTVNVAGATDCFLVLHRPRDEYRDYTIEVPPPPQPPVPQIKRNTMASPLPAYRITRSPRPIAGEPELLLPTNVAIDIMWTRQSLAGNPQNNPQQVQTYTRTWPAPDANGNANPSSLFTEVMFSPSGEVTGGLGGAGRVIFWLRDVSLDSASPTLPGLLPPGDNRLLVLHCRTGQISTHPVDQTLVTSGPLIGTLDDPYTFVRDGKSSNLKDE